MNPELVVAVIVVYVCMLIALTPGPSEPGARMDMTDEDVLREQLDDLWIGQNK